MGILYDLLFGKKNKKAAKSTKKKAISPKKEQTATYHFKMTFTNESGHSCTYRTYAKTRTEAEQELKQYNPTASNIKVSQSKQ